MAHALRAGPAARHRSEGLSPDRRASSAATRSDRSCSNRFSSGRRRKIAEDFNAASERVHLVVTPTSPGVAFPLGAKTDDPLAMYLNDYFTVPMPLAGIPAISIPNGLSEELPTGFQLAGPAFSENRILDAAHALERAIVFDARPQG